MLSANLSVNLGLILAVIFILLIGGVFATALVMYLIDRYQTSHAIRRNFPLLGRFRYVFEHLGTFFRQYFFSMDREELPFNRAQRSWIYRAAKNLDNTQAFGSTRDINRPGNILFVNAAFPVLDKPASPENDWQLCFGPHCEQPYRTTSLFNISAMSFGAISKPAVQALSKGAAEAGCWLNTGEGALSPWHREANCDLLFQIGTANYGVRNGDGSLSDAKLKAIGGLDQVKMFELKLSQGAKPGKGGILPAAKVTGEIAEIRGIPVGKDSISPNRHEDIESIEDLLNKIIHIRQITAKPVGIKFVLGQSHWLDRFFELIQSRGSEHAPDFITLDSADGGTGAAPMSLIDDMGLSLKESLPLLVDKLNNFDLKERIKVIASGKLVNPSDVAWALCVGADCVVTARGFMFSLGCIQALQCNQNTCPTGITTHDPHLQRGLVPDDKARRVANYHRNMLKELMLIAHSCGVEHPSQLRRHHARQVVSPGISQSLTEVYAKRSGL